MRRSFVSRSEKVFLVRKPSDFETTFSRKFVPSHFDHTAQGFSEIHECILSYPKTFLLTINSKDTGENAGLSYSRNLCAAGRLFSKLRGGQ